MSDSATGPKLNSSLIAVLLGVEWSHPVAIARGSGPYYLWRRHIDGKQVNRTLRPGPQLERVREGIANYHQLQELLGEWLVQEESQVLESGRAVAPSSKKNFKRSLRRR